MCFSYCSALASEYLFEQTATAAGFCVCTDFEQLFVVPPSPAPTLRQAGRNKIAAMLPLGVLDLHWERDTAEAGRARSAQNQLMNCTGQMWSSLNAFDEKWGLFIAQVEDDPGWGRADHMGSSSVPHSCSSALGVRGASLSWMCSYCPDIFTAQMMASV